MTDLLSRPTASGTRDDTGSVRPLTVSATFAALLSALVPLVLLMAVAVIGWFLADAGGHGDTPDALRVAVDVWLAAHGSTITVSGAPLSIMPLTLTAVVAVSCFRAGRWAGRSSAPIYDDRSLAVSMVVCTGVYVITAVVLGVLAGESGATPGLGGALVGSLVISVACHGAGMAIGTRRAEPWLRRVPPYAATVVQGAFATVLVMFAASAVLMAVALALGMNRASDMMSGLDLGVGDALAYSFLAVLLAPNAVLLAGSYLVGPGFAVGTGTVVSPGVVTLGPVPAFPLLAALPAEGPTPWWLMLFLAVPVLAAAYGAALAQRHYQVLAWDSAALRGFGVGLGAAVLLTVVTAFAGGAMGTGRMADIGPGFGEMLAAAIASMSMGGLVGGLVMAWWLRRKQRASVA